MNVRFSQDLYVLASGRTRAVVERFTREWLDGFDPAAEEYELPHFATDATVVYDSAEQLIDVLLQQPDEPYGLYWRNAGEGPVPTAMLFFTPDGEMIVGLRVDGDRSTAVQYLKRLAKTVDGRFGYITCEEPPADTAAELIELARRASPALVDGIVDS